MPGELHLGDGVAWLASRGEASATAVVTDPPFGAEYGAEQLAKRRAGSGGLWRQPTTLNGCRRRPAPRFTALTARQLAEVAAFFERFARPAFRALVPGGHAFVAATPLLAHLAQGAAVAAGFEYRGSVIRLVRTRRGGDRPRFAEGEFPEVSAMPRGCWEPWLLFRKPLSERTLAANLRRWGAGALRRPDAGKPFEDVIPSGPAPDAERAICDHDSLKPQRFMRRVVRASLPLGVGAVLDPFAGGGSTLAAAEALGYAWAGAEIDPAFHAMALAGVPRLAALAVES